MARIVLGNTAPIQAVKVSPDSTAIKRIPMPEIAPTVTEFNAEGELEHHDILGLANTFRTHHSDAEAAWVESDDADVAEVLAKEFGCPVKNKPRRKKKATA